MSYARSTIYDAGKDVDCKRDYITLKKRINGATSYDVAMAKRKLKGMAGTINAIKGKATVLKAERIQVLYPLLLEIAQANVELELLKSTIGFNQEYNKVTDMLFLAEKTIKQLLN